VGSDDERRTVDDGGNTVTTAISRPRIRIVNDDGNDGARTTIYDEHGNDITASLQVHKIELTLEVGKINQAVLHTHLFGGLDMSAEVAAIKETLIPPPQPTDTLRLTVYEPVRRWWGGRRSRYRLLRETPLPGFGESAFTVAEGWLAPVGPLTVEAPA
jgi:hypothetical protein